MQKLLSNITEYWIGKFVFQKPLEKQLKAFKKTSRTIGRNILESITGMLWSICGKTFGKSVEKLRKILLRNFLKFSQIASKQFVGKLLENV